NVARSLPLIALNRLMNKLAYLSVVLLDQWFLNFRSRLMFEDINSLVGLHCYDQRIALSNLILLIEAAEIVHLRLLGEPLTEYLSGSFEPFILINLLIRITFLFRVFIVCRKQQCCEGILKQIFPKRKDQGFKLLVCEGGGIKYFG